MNFLRDIFQGFCKKQTNKQTNKQQQQKNYLNTARQLLKMSIKGTFRSQSKIQGVKIANGLQPLTVSTKVFMLGIWLGPEYFTE